MIYPKSPFCPLNSDDAKRKNYVQENQTERNINMPIGNNTDKHTENNMSQSELIEIINELEFAITDLNLFLDTHPNEEEALKTFTTLAAALKSYKHDYVQKYGPISVTDSSDEAPFEWVSEKHKWPWEV